MGELRSQLVGAFTGYDDGAVFQLTNGQTWQQRRYKYAYKYEYRPSVRIYQNQLNWFAEFDCMNGPIEVVQVSVLEEGTVISEFKGFSGNSRFEFQSGHIWARAEYKYSYHYAYQLHALIIDRVNDVELHVEDMDEHVRVRRI